MEDKKDYADFIMVLTCVLVVIFMSIRAISFGDSLILILVALSFAKIYPKLP